jgi:hypothetical protein
LGGADEFLYALEYDAFGRDWLECFRDGGYNFLFFNFDEKLFRVAQRDNGLAGQGTQYG